MADVIQDGSAGRDLVALAQELAGRRGLIDAEVYAKSGRSRVFEIELRPEGDHVVPAAQRVGDRRESGWAMRYGAKRGWGFTSGSGEPPLDPPLVRPRGDRLLLPHTPGPERPQSQPAPLISETRAQRGVAGLVDALPPVAIARRLSLQDGAATSRLANNHGLSVDWQHRIGLVTLEEWLPSGATLRLHAVAEGAVTALEIAVELWPEVVTYAQRVRWVPPPDEPRTGTVAEDNGDENAGGQLEVPAPPAEVEKNESRRSNLILSPQAAAPLVGSALRRWSADDRDTIVASPVVQLCDAPDWPAGPLSAPVDGQGQALERRAVVHDGRLVATLADAETAVVRRGWRDLPQPGYQQPVLLPGAAGVDELIAGVDDGWWLPAPVEVPAAVSGSRPLVFLGRRIRRGAIDRSAPPRLLVVDVRPADFCRSIRELAGEIHFQPSSSGVLGLPAVRVVGVRVREC